MLTSWRIRGIALGILVFVIGTFLYSAANPPPDAVNSPLKVFLIMLAMITPMLAAGFPVVAFISWRSEKKYLEPKQVALTGEGIEFADRDGTGLLPWTTYTYYLENRWSFFVWNPRGPLWFMFPKREFASPSDIEQCRDLLRTHLRVSRWFFL